MRCWNGTQAEAPRKIGKAGHREWLVLSSTASGAGSSLPWVAQTPRRASRAAQETVDRVT